MNIKETLKHPEYDFLRTEERLKDNILLLTYGGSISYGTNGPQSDIDIRGIMAPSKEDILGCGFLRKAQEDNPNLIWGPAGFEQYNDKNTDTIIYCLDKIIELLYKCNPNTIEILGCRPEDYAMVSEAGQLLLDNRSIFLSKMAYDSFSGYARQQFYRLKNALARDTMSLTEKQFYMIDVVERTFNHLEQAYPSFNRDMVKFIVSDTEGNPVTINNEIVSLDDIVFKYKGKIMCACEAFNHELDLNNTVLKVQLNMDTPLELKDFSGVYNEISAITKDFTSHVGHRNKKKDEYHLHKHAMHLIRLYLMCFDIFEKKEIITYRGEDLDLLMKIKNGYYMQPNGNYRPEFYQMVDDFDKKLKKLYEASDLPDRPDPKAVEDLVIKIKQTFI